MPHITAKIWTGRSEEEKQKLADELAATVVRVLGSNITSVSVAVEDVSPEDWNEIYRKDIVDKKSQIYVEPGYSYELEDKE